MAFEFWKASFGHGLPPTVNFGKPWNPLTTQVTVEMDGITKNLRSAVVEKLLLMTKFHLLNSMHFNFNFTHFSFTNCLFCGTNSKKYFQKIHIFKNTLTARSKFFSASSLNQICSCYFLSIDRIGFLATQSLRSAPKSMPPFRSAPSIHASVARLISKPDYACVSEKWNFRRPTGWNRMH